MADQLAAALLSTAIAAYGPREHTGRLSARGRSLLFPQPTAFVPSPPTGSHCSHRPAPTGCPARSPTVAAADAAKQRQLMAAGGLMTIRACGFPWAVVVVVEWGEHATWLVGREGKRQSSERRLWGLVALRAKTLLRAISAAAVENQFDGSAALAERASAYLPVIGRLFRCVTGAHVFSGTESSSASSFSPT